MTRKIRCVQLINNLCLVVITLLLAACNTTTVIKSPSPTAPVSKAKAHYIASEISESISGSIIGQGYGESMNPIMGHNTILIIKPVPFDDLEEGMIVAYRDKDANRIVHQLVLKVNESDVAKGWNNKKVDNEYVTEDNLIGVILGLMYYDIKEDENLEQPKYLLRKE